MNLKIPELSLVVLIGPSGCGKSTFAMKHFLGTEIVSSDYCRGVVSDDDNNQAVTSDAFDLVHYIIGKRLKLGKLAVVDATNVNPQDRKHLIQIAREYHALPVAIVLKTPERTCHERNVTRDDRNFGPDVIRRQISQMKRGLRGLKREGFRYVYELDSVEAIDAATIERQSLWNNRRDDHGPFDIIGDIHGCYPELHELLTKLGYSISSDMLVVSHPEGRRVLFVGDLVDRGPDSVAVLRLAMANQDNGQILCVPGNHDIKLMRKLSGKNVQLTHGLAETMQQLESTDEAFHQAVRAYIDSLVSHFVFDDGKLVVAHAGMKENMQGRGSGKVREFALYGETTGETDEYGLPVRHDWAAEYRGKATVVYGHTPIPEAEWLNNTIDIDTGCVFGGKLTALRYPEMELVHVEAQQVYCEPAKPFLPEESTVGKLTAQQTLDSMLEIGDLLGKRIVSTRLRPNITIREENSMAALEVMSRFAVNPKWLIYLPPTMSPCATSSLDDYLEHPIEALQYFRTAGVPSVICEEKHMGSRAIIILCRDASAAQQRFGILNEGIGTCYTRTGRPFFNDKDLETAFLARIRDALTQSGFWEKLETDWVCLDCELMPWSMKAQELLSRQYAAVGASSIAYTNHALSALRQADTSKLEITELLKSFEAKANALNQYKAAYRQYCWPVNSINDLKLAPFHIMATEGTVHADKNHLWHMEQIHSICHADPEILLATRYKQIDLTEEASIQTAVDWWLELTSKGGEGMVVKPLDFIANSSKRHMVQPAVKCRGREYLRIIYGPEYTRSEHLDRLKQRGLGAKRSLAEREFALGIEALERFVRCEPLRRVHECAFSVLALESEPVDPRL